MNEVAQAIFTWPPEKRLVRRWVHRGLHCAVAGGGWSFCGYVLVTKGPDADKGVRDLEMALDVHGGVTFSDAFPEGRWIGWDAGHYNDEIMGVQDGKRWLIKDMVEETNKLADQLAERAKLKLVEAKKEA